MNKKVKNIFICIIAGILLGCMGIGIGTIVVSSIDFVQKLADEHKTESNAQELQSDTFCFVKYRSPKITGSFIFFAKNKQEIFNAIEEKRRAEAEEFGENFIVDDVYCF